MITGYNTDVRHGNRVFHIQTEDKGLANPKIETLIYVGGEILDNYRSSYDDILTEGQAPAENIIQSRMDDQHKAVIRDIKSGKYDTTPPDPVEAAAFNDRPLDVAILEYLQREGDVDTLEFLLEEPVQPRFGKSCHVQLYVRLCNSQRPLPGLDVNVKLISSIKKALPLATGKTNPQGLFETRIQMPASQPGQCALVVSCLSDFGFDEIKAMVTEG